MKKVKVIILILLIILAAIIYFVWSQPKEIGPLIEVEGASVFINNNLINAEIAASSEELIRGLSGRLEIRDNQGMLFVFPEADLRSFWMKDMNFAIDLLWINNNQIVGFEHNMLPPETGLSDSNLPRFISPSPVNKVLEFSSGSIEKFDIKVGDEVKIQYYSS